MHPIVYQAQHEVHYSYLVNLHNLYLLSPGITKCISYRIDTA